MKSKLLTFFRQPYPFGNFDENKAPVIIGISSFIFLFLFIFAPFGLAQHPFSTRALICFGYGAVAAFSMIFDVFLTNTFLIKYFKEECWTVGRQLLLFGFILLTTSIFESIYTVIIGLNTFSIRIFVTFIVYVFLIGIFPVYAVVVTDYWRKFKKNEKQASQLKAKLEYTYSDDRKKLVLTSANQRERLQLKQSQLLYLKSEDNYVGVVYRNHSKIQEKLLRGSLKDFEKQLKHSPVIRCHRSFLVNLSQVINISGNARGYLLELRNSNHSIPVSRTYNDRILSKLDS